jgi:hypothetical protein
MLIEIQPYIKATTIPVSGSVRGRSIDCDLARTISITSRCLYHASADDALQLSLLFSPDGRNYDTIAYTSHEIAVTQGASVQKTVLIDPPEAGFLIPVATNLSTNYAISNVTVWVGASKYWEDIQEAMKQYNKRGGKK